MTLKTDYLGIHASAYRQLTSQRRESFSPANDLKLREAFYAQSLERSAVSEGAKLLVLGCGDGEMALRLAQQGFAVTGWDIVPEAIDWARRKGRDRRIGANFEVVDMVSEIRGGGGFEVVLDDHCFHCIIGDDRKIFLRNVRSSLKQKGIFVLRTHCDDPPATMPEAVLKMWDPMSRCQVFGGVAGRYMGRRSDILREIEEAGFRLVEANVFEARGEWPLLEALFRVS